MCLGFFVWVVDDITINASACDHKPACENNPHRNGYGNKKNSLSDIPWFLLEALYCINRIHYLYNSMKNT